MSNKTLIDYIDVNTEKTISSAIESESISLSGAKKVVQHSSLFYQPFSEVVCEQICDIFNEFINAPTNFRNRTLSKIERTISSDNDNEIPTVECMLYASRIANSRIDNDSYLFDELAKVVAQCYEYNSEISFEAVRHIFKWGWDCQIGLALVGALQAEKNPVKRKQILSDMDKYIAGKDDKTHKLLLYKVKALVSRNNEYMDKIKEVLYNLDSKYTNDCQIANIIIEEASSIFKYYENELNTQDAKIGLAKQTVNKIKQSMGVTDNKKDEYIKEGNTDPNKRSEILKKIKANSVNVEYYCKVIRENRLESYIEGLESLVYNSNLSLHNKCCITLTISQMLTNNEKFKSFLRDAKSIDKDYKYLLCFVFFNKQSGQDSKNRAIKCIQDAINFYFSESCSYLLDKGIKHITKYDIEVTKQVLNRFATILQENNEKTDPSILKKFDNLLQDQKSKIRNIIKKNSDFLKIFDSYLQNSYINLDAFPEFFDEMINIVEHCPKETVPNFLFNMYNKTRNENRKRTLRYKMGDIDVNS